MLLFILFIVVLAIIGMLIFLSEGCRTSEVFYATITCGAIGAALGATICLCIGGSFEYEQHPRGEVELVALRNGSDAGGRLYVRGGYVSSSPHFLFYTKTPDGYQPGHVRADRRVLIREEKRETAILKSSCEAIKDRSDLMWGFDLSNDENCRYVFIVPEGTVQRGFSLQ